MKRESGIIAALKNKKAKSMARGAIASFLGMFVMACSGCGGGGGGGSEPVSHSAPIAPAASVKTAGIGFFTPEGSHAELVNKMQFGMVIAHTPDELANNLKVASGTMFKVNVDFSAVAEQPMVVSSIRTTYRDLAGNQYTKSLPPIATTKLKQLPASDQLKATFAPFFDVIKQYAPNVGVVFLADEPYLNGIPKSEMERAGAIARQELDARGLQSVKLGINFASGMFDARFAAMIDAQAGEYAKGIDEFYASGQATPQWVSTITTSRLSTYDTAGNMYTGGGIPSGYDVVGYDFYLSTILLDNLHQNTLSWFATNYPDAGCAQFAGMTMAQIRGKLSFFDHNSMQPGTQGADRTLLDSIYECRMQATTTMIQNDLAGRNIQLLMISESSNNGVLEFDSNGTPKQNQPSLLVDARVLDEVNRAEKFFTAHQQPYSAGLMFFTYENAFDESINLSIGGASGMPSVMSSIFAFSQSTNQ